MRIIETSFTVLLPLLLLTNLSSFFELAANGRSYIESVDNGKPLSDHCHTGSYWDQSAGRYKLNLSGKQGAEENDVEGSGHTGEDSYAIAGIENGVMERQGRTACASSAKVDGREWR